jgi:Asp-tRNA(Asn)/Glu-tRNA(Gln) amidotransferase A subunit family amidase
LVTAAESLAWLSIEEAAGQLRSGTLTATALCEATLERVRTLNPELHALLSVDESGARLAATAADARIETRRAAPLTGIPISVKDHFATRRLPTTVASALFEGFETGFDAAVVERAVDAGAVVIGKANMYELGSGWGTFGHFPVALNPWNADHSPGGSSSGSAAGVAAGLSLGSIASDGGGSARVPANYCGVVGFKPTHGRVSFFGSIPVPEGPGPGKPSVRLAKSISAVGVITRTVRDAAIMLGTLAGHDPRDPGTLLEPADEYIGACVGEARGVVVGVPWASIRDAVSMDVAEAFDASLRVLESAGARIREMPSPQLLEEVGEIWMTIAYVEMATAYADLYAASPERIGPEMVQRIETGLATSPAAYRDADARRSELRAQFLSAMDGCDVIATPTAPAAPPSMDELRRRASDLQDIGQLAMFTRPHNLTGFPAITVPNGLANGLPLGLQIAARSLDERAALRVADAFERRTDWHRLHPPIADTSNPGANNDA